MKNLPPACQKFKKAGNLEVGSVVMIRDDLPRMKWNVGIVEKLCLGGDGLSRVAVVKTSQGKKTRPVQKLHCLELARLDEDVLAPDERSTVTENQRPSRQTVLPAKLRDYVLD